MTDLEKLIAAVDAGRSATWFTISQAIERPASGPEVKDVQAANDGSVDAAARLHDGLLPGWGVSSMCQLWDVTPGGEYIGISKDWFVQLQHSDGDLRSFEAEATASLPARAFLLAILRALQSQVTA